MPIFEYVCQDCGSRFELLRSASSTEPADCPGCGSINTQKQLSAFASSGSNSSGTGHSCGGSGFS